MNDTTHFSSNYDEYQDRSISSRKRKIRLEKQALETKLADEERSVIRIQGHIRGLENDIRKKEQTINNFEIGELSRLERELKKKQEEIHKIQKMMDDIDLDMKKKHIDIEKDQKEIETEKRKIVLENEKINNLKTVIDDLGHKLE